MSQTHTRTETEAEGVCARLYRENAELQGFIACWIRDKRCPYGLADWLRDHDLEAPARAADWAATERDRSAWERDEKGGLPIQGPFPSPSPGGRYNQHKAHWYWFIERFELTNSDPCDLIHSSWLVDHPTRLEGTQLDSKLYEVHDALLWLLDNWK